MNSGVAGADEAASAIAVAYRAQTEFVARDEIELYAGRRQKAAEFNLATAGQALEYLQGGQSCNRPQERGFSVSRRLLRDGGRVSR